MEMNFRITPMLFKCSFGKTKQPYDGAGASPGAHGTRALINQMTGLISSFGPLFLDGMPGYINREAALVF